MSRRLRLSYTSLAGCLSSTGPAFAPVNGSPITMTEVELVLKKAGPKATAPTEAQRREMQQEAIPMLIDDQLMRDFLRKKGPIVDLQDVNKQMAELVEGLKKEKKSLNEY